MLWFLKLKGTDRPWILTWVWRLTAFLHFFWFFVAPYWRSPGHDIWTSKAAYLLDFRHSWRASTTRSHFHAGVISTISTLSSPWYQGLKECSQSQCFDAGESLLLWAHFIQREDSTYRCALLSYQMFYWYSFHKMRFDFHISHMACCSFSNFSISSFTGFVIPHFLEALLLESGVPVTGSGEMRIAADI